MITLDEAVQTIRTVETKWNQIVTDILNKKFKTTILIESPSNGFRELLMSSIFKDPEIPYRYECALNLDGRVYYPDFTIMHPITKKIYNWEHFGMMDDSVYRSDAYHKLDIYGQHGIYLNINLITTSEVKDNLVNSMLVDSLIVQYFEPDTWTGI